MPSLRRRHPRLARRCLLPLLLLAALLPAHAAGAAPLQDDLRARRAQVMDRLGPDAVAIFWSAPARIYSNDVDYEYRQDSNLLYLTGIDQEDTMLVLLPGSDGAKEFLFIR
ncbi:MAG: aminopeptidase P N-terminal domain-containing protein, partial [Acidobacteriota bacterium]